MGCRLALQGTPMSGDGWQIRVVCLKELEQAHAHNLIVPQIQGCQSCPKGRREPKFAVRGPDYGGQFVRYQPKEGFVNRVRLLVVSHHNAIS
jgi:hypothetical protein